jgi:hypothetical protein
MKSHPHHLHHLHPLNLAALYGLNLIYERNTSNTWMLGVLHMIVIFNTYVKWQQTLQPSGCR